MFDFTTRGLNLSRQIEEKVMNPLHYDLKVSSSQEIMAENFANYTC